MMQPLDPFTFPKQLFAQLNFSKIPGYFPGTGSLSAVSRIFLSSAALHRSIMSLGNLISFEETSKRNADVSIFESSSISFMQLLISVFRVFSFSCRSDMFSPCSNDNFPTNGI